MGPENYTNHELIYGRYYDSKDHGIVRYIGSDNYSAGLTYIFVSSNESKIHCKSHRVPYWKVKEFLADAVPQTHDEFNLTGNPALLPDYTEIVRDRLNNGWFIQELGVNQIKLRKKVM